MKFAIIALFLAFNASAFVVTPDEMQFQCSKKGYMDVTMIKLQDHTKSKVSKVDSYLVDKAVCEIVREHFVNQSSIEVIVQSDVFEVARAVKDLPCDGYLCKTIFQKTLHERVQVYMSNVHFSVYGVVPNSETQATIEWDRRYCKPYDANCEF